MDTQTTTNVGTVLVTGITGYIGGRLATALIEAGYRVRVLVREAARLQGRAWLEQVEVAEGDASDQCRVIPPHPSRHQIIIPGSCVDERDQHQRRQHFER